LPVLFAVPLFLLVPLLLGAASMDDPWLRLTPTPSRALVSSAGSHRDAVVRITLENRGRRPVTVNEVRIVYLAGERQLGAKAGGPDFFRAGGIDRERRVERGSRVDWIGICLSPVPGDADRVRFELELSSRHGMGKIRSSQSLEVLLRPAPSPRSLKLPFVGIWQVTQGHGCNTNHRLGGYGGEFSWDFVALDPASGSSRSRMYAITRRNHDTVTFGSPILAPASGKVVRIVEDEPDNEGLRDFPRRSLTEDLGRPLWVFGNHVVLDVGGGQYVLLGHLMKESILVSVGEEVEAGAPLAAAGNSGNSIEPHLHVQVMDRSDLADSAISGVPALFRDYVEIVGHRHEARRDALVRRMDAGDPPEGALVAPLPVDPAESRAEGEGAPASGP